jgi:2-iminobutanoate/2-iminopropanoate deaminase
MSKFLFVLFFVVLLVSSAFSQKQSKAAKEYINPKSMAKSQGYSQAIAISGGKIIFTSGQVALNAKGELVGAGDLKAQTVQAFENLKTVLAASGATFSDVVKFGYFVKDYDPAKVAVIRSVRDSYLPKVQPPPASTLVGVQSLFREDVLIEIEAIAVMPK